MQCGTLDGILEQKRQSNKNRREKKHEKNLQKSE